MARRSDHSREELAGLVREAARAIAAIEGWRGVTMRAIATRIGYAPGSIYNAVGDLDAVLLRVNAGTLEDLGGWVEDAVRRCGPDAAVIQRALAIADSYMRFVTENARLWASVLERVPAADSPVSDWYAAPRARLIEIPRRKRGVARWWHCGRRCRAWRHSRPAATWPSPPPISIPATSRGRSCCAI